MEVYRIALFISDIGWPDVSKLMRDPRTIKVADQLFRALGSISANISEGYSRSTGKARALYMEHALGSARESRDWYFKARFLLGTEVTNHRLEILTQIIRLLLTMLPEQRKLTRISEEPAPYETLPTFLSNTIPYPEN
ncbi:MAG TPA: four helix bundle protein [Anaerolineales bacterium]|nr:four helix bundle protein [Anaerolineales bacterium]